MANNYQESSSYLTLPEDKLDAAMEIVEKEMKKIEEDEDGYGYCGFTAEKESNGIWFYGEESIDVDHLEQAVREVIEQLEIDEPFYASWSYTCSKPRVDEFGGGAFAIVRGKPTVWIDAMSEVKNRCESLLDK